jgi:hypothetical protein
MRCGRAGGYCGPGWVGGAGATEQERACGAAASPGPAARVRSTTPQTTHTTTGWGEHVRRPLLVDGRIARGGGGKPLRVFQIQNGGGSSLACLLR